MYTVFVTGGIGSGKSVFTARLAAHGAALVDLDRLNGEVLENPEVQRELVDAFGSDVVVAQTVVRSTLSRRAFANPEATARLNAITHPRILDLLSRRIEGGCGCVGQRRRVTVVEFQLIEHAGEALGLADEVVCICCPRASRREHALARGMSGADFDARDARQVDDDARKTWCTTLVSNTGSLEDLIVQADAWWEAREAAGWKRTLGEDGDRL